MVTARATSAARASRREGDLEAQIQHALQQLTLSQRPDRAEKEKYARFARGEAAVAKARAELARECEPDRSARAVPLSREDKEARELEPRSLGSFGRPPTTRPTFAPRPRPTEREAREADRPRYGRHVSPFSAPSGAVGAAQRASSTREAAARAGRPASAAIPARQLKRQPEIVARTSYSARPSTAGAAGQSGPFAERRSRPTTAPADQAHRDDTERDVREQHADRDIGPERKQVVVSRGDRSQLIAYTMGERVGQGAYAAVRMGWRKDGGDRVAVKVYDKSNLTRESRRRNVQREVHVLGKISHPHIVGFHEWFATDRHVYIVMEYVAGGSLQALLRRQPGGRFDEPQAKRLHFQVLCGVQYLHSLRIMHRDLKLENLLLDSTGKVQIIDFGFAVVLPNAQKLKIFCGTPSYIAPEIIQGHPYSLPADIWAMGVLLYVMLSGRFPFKASSQRELYRRIVRSQMQVPSDFSPQAACIVQACLQKDDAPRPTASALLHDGYYASVERVDASERIRASTTSSGSSLGFATSDATTAATDAGLIVSKLR